MDNYIVQVDVRGEWPQEGPGMPRKARLLRLFRLPWRPLAGDAFTLTAKDYETTRKVHGILWRESVPIVSLQGLSILDSKYPERFDEAVKKLTDAGWTVLADEDAGDIAIIDGLLRPKPDAEVR